MSPFENEPQPPQNLQPKRIKPPTVKDTQYTNDYPDWGAVPPPGAMHPPNLKTHGNMPFIGKPVNQDYGDFKGLQEHPIQIEPAKGQKYAHTNHQEPTGSRPAFLGRHHLQPLHQTLADRPRKARAKA
jgi:hypothetical protein